MRSPFSDTNGIRPGAAGVARKLLEAGLWVATGRQVSVVGAGDFDTTSELSKESLVARALTEKMVPMLEAYARAVSWDLGPVPAQLAKVFQHISGAHYRCLGDVVERLRGTDVKLMLLKGGDLDLTLYPREVPRSMADLDLLVRPPDFEALKGALVAAGFRHGLFDRESLTIRPIGDFERQQAQAEGMELMELSKIVKIPELSPYQEVIAKALGGSVYHRLAVLGPDVYSLIEFDVHLNLSTGFDVQDVWWEPRTISLPDGGEILGQSQSDLLWFLAARLYHEILLHNRASMRYFVDVVALLERFADRIDWERVVFMGHKYKLDPSLFYTLWHAREILGSLVPDFVVESFDLLRGSADRSHDWGDFVSKMLGEVGIQPLLA